MKNLKRNFGYNLIYQVLVIILPLITAPYVARVLGAENIGIYSFSHSVAYYFLLFGMLGITNHGNRSIAKVAEDRDLRSKEFINIYSIQFVAYVIALTIYIFYVFLFVEEYSLIFILQTLYILSGIFDINWLFFGLEKFKLTVTRNIIIRLITVLSIFIFVNGPDDLWIYTIIMTSGTLISNVYLWLFLPREITFKKIKYEAILNHLKPIFIMFIPVISYIIYKVMDKIMLGILADYFIVGIYENATKITGIPTGVLTAFSTVMLPRMSNLASYNKVNSDFSDLIFNSFKFVGIIAPALSFGLIGVSGNLAPVYFGEEFRASGNVIAILAISILFSSISGVIRTQYLIPLHKDKVYLVSTIIGAIFNLIVNLMLIPVLHGIGAAIGTIVAEATVFIVQYKFVSKELDVKKMLLSVVPFLFIGIGMSVITSIIGVVLQESIATLIIQIVVGASVYLSLISIYLYVKKDPFWYELVNIISKFRIGASKWILF